MKTKYITTALFALWGALLAVALMRRFFTPTPPVLPVVRLRSSCLGQTWADELAAACEFARQNACLAELEVDGLTLLVGPDDDVIRLMDRLQRLDAERTEARIEAFYAGSAANREPPPPVNTAPDLAAT